MIFQRPTVLVDPGPTVGGRAACQACTGQPAFAVTDVDAGEFTRGGLTGRGPGIDL